jgi:hypothetical protein
MPEPTRETPSAAPLVSEPPTPEQLPADHPLVKTLAEQKKSIKDLKAKASRLDEIEEAQKTETEKAADRIAKADAEVATIPAKVADALREHLVALHEIDKDDAGLFLTANEPDLLLRQVTRLLGQSDKRKKQGNFVPREGNNPKPGDDPMREFTRNLFAKSE